jgi:hypothetical protein
MKTFNHCDENFLSFDSVQKTSLLRMAEKAFFQMGKIPLSLIRQSSTEEWWKRKKRRGMPRLKEKSKLMIMFL